MSSPLLQIEPHPHFPFIAQSASARLLKEFSQSLAGVTPASRLEVRPAPERAASGVAAIDALTGGWPRGCLTEISGPESSGRTTLMLSALAAATRRQEVCALIDASDAFHPHSADAAGIKMERLLWVRCGSCALAGKRRAAANLKEWERRRMEDPVEQALRATDLLLQSSGFGMVIIDLASVSTKMARRIPLTTWFRFRRAVENTATILLVLGTQTCAESCASLVLKLSSQLSSQLPVLGSQFPVLSSQTIGTENTDQGKEEQPSHAELFTGIEIQAEIRRSRGERKPMQSVSAFESKTAWTA